MHTDFFYTIDLFSQASQKSLKELSLHAKFNYYKKNSLILLRQQSHCTFLYLMKGWVKLFKESMAGEEVIIDILSEGKHYGEIFLFETGTVATAYTAKSISEVEAITLPVQFLKKLMLEDHALSLSFLHSTLEKQQQIHLQLEHRSIQTAAQRIGCFILRLCHAPDANKAITLQFPYDKGVLALQLGMRAETFSRGLIKLSSQCGLKINGETIYIPKIQKLMQYVR